VIALVWFKNNLRIHDNEPLFRACKNYKFILPVYVFDDRQFAPSELGFPKTGSFRAKFLMESVSDLQKSIDGLGGSLIVKCGKPERIVPYLAAKYKVKSVFSHKEITSEEIQIEKELESELSKLDVKLELFLENTLYHIEDIPFQISDIPDVFTKFRKTVERNSPIRSPYPTVRKLPSLPEDINTGKLPSLDELKPPGTPLDKRSVLKFRGGESEALKRLRYYIWETESLSHYKQTRNDLLGENYSSKFSPWLANGSLSVRKIFEEIKRFEEQVTKNISTYWLVLELIWRDYFKYVALKYGNDLFKRGGIKRTKTELGQNGELFNAWRNGKTGIPFIDANMRELNSTGFMSNRGRQNVASFLVKDLKVEWTWGASYFESELIDYDVTSNWGNWNYVAGIGNDPREKRYFNVISQAKKYDPDGKYVKHWLPELSKIPKDKVHTPYRLTAMEEKLYGTRLGLDYPKPVYLSKFWDKY
jgi:deoxyribodipyrimidine photo-lyase